MFLLLLLIVVNDLLFSFSSFSLFFEGVVLGDGDVGLSPSTTRGTQVEGGRGSCMFILSLPLSSSLFFLFF